MGPGERLCRRLSGRRSPFRFATHPPTKRGAGRPLTEREGRKHVDPRKGVSGPSRLVSGLPAYSGRAATAVCDQTARHTPSLLPPLVATDPLCRSSPHSAPAFGHQMTSPVAGRGVGVQRPHRCARGRGLVQGHRLSMASGGDNVLVPSSEDASAEARLNELVASSIIDVVAQAARSCASWRARGSPAVRSRRCGSSSASCARRPRDRRTARRRSRGS